MYPFKSNSLKYMWVQGHWGQNRLESSRLVLVHNTFHGGNPTKTNKCPTNALQSEENEILMSLIFF